MNKEWLHIACRRSIVMRGLKYGAVVGLILILINHGNALVEGSIDTTRLIQMLLTVLVPYCVSTASSVSAVMEHRSESSNS
jgi:hypothetical protein